MALVDDLTAQVNDLTDQLRQEKDRSAVLNSRNLELMDKLSAAQSTVADKDSVISGVVAQHGRVTLRLQKLIALLDSKAPFDQYTKPQIVAFLQIFYDKITTPVPTDDSAPDNT